MTVLYVKPIMAAENCWEPACVNVTPESSKRAEIMIWPARVCCLFLHESARAARFEERVYFAMAVDKYSRPRFILTAVTRYGARIRVTRRDNGPGACNHLRRVQCDLYES